MTALLLLSQLVFAGELYVNDVLVNPVDLQGMTLEKVDVAIDGSGNIKIAAPGYKIQVVNPTPMPATSTAATGQPANQGEGYYPPGAYGQAYGSQGAPPPPPKAEAPLDATVPAATWWLVSEDSSTTGHKVEVYINGRLAQRLESGQAQLILDVGKHVKHGTNTVTVKGSSVSPTGGSLFVFVGTGSDRSGTVVMDTPQVEFQLTSRESGPIEKTYEFTY